MRRAIKACDGSGENTRVLVQEFSLVGVCGFGLLSVRGDRAASGQAKR